MPQSSLIDYHNRRIHKLRVQITDACNFRCFYCMPESVKFIPSERHLKADEIIEICSNLTDLGIDEIRVSGGEPLLRADVDEIIDGLSSLNLLRLGMTTNAYQLEEHLPFLKKTRCRNINISMDSLNRATFEKVTRTRYFDTVYRAVCKTREAGFHTKVNVVAMRGVNDHEVFDYLKFSARHDVEVRFLELMKIGPSINRYKELFIPAQEMIKRIEQQYELIPQSVNCDSTSFNFCTHDGARIGFIASESQPFCDFCSRLRLTSTGTLRACLMSEAGLSLRGKKRGEYPGILKHVMGLKPTGRIESIKQPMYQIGG